MNEFEEDDELAEPEDVEIMVDKEPEKEEEVQEEEPKMLTSPPVEAPLPVEAEAEPFEIDMSMVDSNFEPESGIREVTKSLLNGISLRLWSVKLLKDGDIEEDHFNRIFEGYEERYRQTMQRRNEMLGRARDLEAYERALNEAKVGLRELEIRKVIGDLKVGEYEAKAPAFNWDIRSYEQLIAKRTGEIAFLRDLSRVMPAEEISKMKSSAEESLAAIDELEASGKLTMETATTVRTALQATVDFLRDY